MLFPIIKVKDRCYPDVNPHIVGTNAHDVLYVKDNAIHYLNIQCMSGTEYDDATYDFVGVDNEYSFNAWPEVEFMSLDEIIVLAKDHLEESTKAKIESYRMMQKFMEHELEECKKETGIGSDTSGVIF